MAYNPVFQKSSDLFKFDKAKNRYIATLSELGCNGIDTKCAEFFQKLQQGYGFILVSSKNGAKATMKLAFTNKVKSDWCEDEMDVKSWIFQPLKSGNYSLEIVND